MNLVPLAGFTVLAVLRRETNAPAKIWPSYQCTTASGTRCGHVHEYVKQCMGLLVSEIPRGLENARVYQHIQNRRRIAVIENEGEGHQCKRDFRHHDR